MLKLIVGTKGSGKTKTMIDMIDKAVKTTSGTIVVIEKFVNNLAFANKFYYYDINMSIF